MSTIAAHTYATLLELARIAALEALTDILKTSDDPSERRHAATAILRAPEPKPSAQPAPECAEPPQPTPRHAQPHGGRASAPPKLSAAEELLALSRTAYGDLTLDEAPEHSPLIPAAPTPAARLASASGAPRASAAGP